MPTFIKTGYWDKLVKAPKGFLNLEELISSSGAITGSGTAGQVAFWTSPSVQSSSSNLVWDSVNNRLGINKTAPSVALDINGVLNLDTATGTGRINAGSTVATTYNNSNFYVAIGSGNQLLYGERDVVMGLRNIVTGRRWNYIYGNDNVIRGLTGGSGNAYNFIFGNNSEIGDSTVPAVYKAEYNRLIGYANKVFATGANSSANNLIGTANAVTNGTINTIIGSAGGVTGLSGVVLILSGDGGLAGQYRFATESNEFSLSSAGKLKMHTGTLQNAVTLFTTGNFAINNTSDAGYKLDVNGTARVSGVLTVLQISAASRIDIFNDGANGCIAMQTMTNSLNLRKYVKVLGDDGGYGNNNASAAFQIDGTNRGFLPPRLTTTQKNAITTPAAGLVVYDTTLNKLCVFTTGWQTITSA